MRITRIARRYLGRMRRLAHSWLRHITDPMAEDYLARRGVVAALADFNAKRPADPFGPDWTDLARLYRKVRRFKPRHFIQYGSDHATLVLAHACHDNGVGHITSLESNAARVTANMAAIPDHLRPFVSITQSPAANAPALDLGGGCMLVINGRLRP